MAKLVIGTTKTNAVPAIVKEVSAQVAEPYLELGVLPNGNLVHSRTTSRLVQLSGFTGLTQYVLAFAYYSNTNITGTATFSDLTSISGVYACLSTFQNSSITGFSAPNLTSINANNACEKMFSGSTITTADLSAVVSIGFYNTCQDMFSNSALSSIDFSSLESISGTNTFNNAFRSCLYLTSISFPKLDSITASDAFYQAFKSSGITTISFPALKSTSFGSRTDQFRNMLSGVTGCTVHFPSNLQAVIGSWADVTAGFGGTNTTILYDLPQTEN